MRLFAKLFLLLTLCAAAPLAVFGGAALWRSRELRQQLLESSARTGKVSAETGEAALFAESRRLHRRVVEARAAELEDFFEEGRKLVGLQTAFAARALAEAPPRAGPPLRSDADMAELRKDSKAAAKVVRVEPYAVYRLAPGTSHDAVRPRLERLARLGDYYAFAHRETPWLKSLYIGSPEGFLLGYPGAAPFPEGYDPRKGDWYKKAVEKGRVTWSNIYLDKDGRPVITVAEPFFEDGRLAGVSAADVVLESLMDRLFDLSDLPASEAVLVNYLGQVRIAAKPEAGGKFKWRSFDPDRAPSVNSYAAGALAPAFEAASRERSGTLVRGGDLLSFARVFIRTRAGGKEWHYLVRTPVEGVTGPAREARGALERLQAALAGAIDAQARSLERALALAALLTLTGALLAATVGARGVARPLAELAAAVRRVGKGDFEVRAPAGGADEVGEVSRAVNEMIAGLKEGVFVKNTFKRYLSASVVDQIIKDPASLKLGGEERELTVFFSDMSGFTEMSERLEPRELVGLVNEYLSAMTDSIFLQQGTLDKYEGDAVMAFWGAPLTQADHARRACWAALDNRSRLKELCKDWERRGLPSFDIRIGINTGPMVVGNVGSTARMEYTVLGDAVNTGSRLEQLNKLYGTHILISEATRDAAGGAVETREVDLIELRGKKRRIRVYELLGLPGQISAARLSGYRLYEHGLTAYREKRWDDAESALRSALAALGEDKPSSLLLGLLDGLRREPPSDGWDGTLHGS
ncbi:MAG: HAMP domain-containing protein [Elusimicrobia bacterium]|nr:HAMP domain-containing protein [Elusimicrobiota bacterium]